MSWNRSFTSSHCSLWHELKSRQACTLVCIPLALKSAYSVIHSVYSENMCTLMPACTNSFMHSKRWTSFKNDEFTQMFQLGCYPKHDKSLTHVNMTSEWQIVAHAGAALCMRACACEAKVRCSAGAHTECFCSTWCRKMLQPAFRFDSDVWLHVSLPIQLLASLHAAGSCF